MPSRLVSDSWEMSDLRHLMERSVGFLEMMNMILAMIQILLRKRKIQY